MTAETPRPGDTLDVQRPGAQQKRHTYIWGSEVPFRNPHFTGREAELLALRTQLQSGVPAVVRQPPHALYGLGGVGKTQVATEYAHRFSDDYEVVWWVRADQEDSIRASIVALGRQLRIPDLSLGDSDRSFRIVIDALQTGDPYAHWLLIFDDVTHPDILRRYIPQGSGHVIVTSRITEWRQVLNTDGIEVKEFPRTDTVRFLRDRVPELARDADGPEEARREEEAARLAEILGDLPLVAEHAAAYLSQTGTSAGEYIEAFKRDAHEVTSRDADMFSTSVAVSTTWNVARHKLSPEARELFQLLAFFAPEPVSEEVLVQPARMATSQNLPEPLQKVLSSRAELKRAERELARFSLVSIYGQRNVIQMHRVVQAVTRGRIEKEKPELGAVFRDTVFALLAATDPESPEKEQNDLIYERSIRHLAPTGALQSDSERLRNLVINQVRRLRLRGAYRESLNLGEAALDCWGAQSDNIQTLALAAEIAVAMRTIGRVDEAFQLNSDTLARLREHYGEENEIYLICANSYGEDLRMRGRFDDALAHDLALLPAYERTFDPGQYRTLSLRNNIAIDLRCVGRLEEALDYDTRNAIERERYFGSTDWQTISSKFGMARDLRRLGRYDEALSLARELAEVMEARNEPWNFLRLDVFAGLSVALRRIGFYAEAHNLAEDVYRRYLEFAGEDHRATLVMATNLACDRRVVDDLTGAQDLGESTVRRWEKVAGTDHPNTLTARGNLAVVLRMRGDLTAARQMNESVLGGFRAHFPYEHPSTLVVMTNLASDLAAVGEVQQARELGEKAFASSRKVRGPSHPATLAVAANLSLDLRATGDLEAARALAEQALEAYNERLSAEHPQARRAHQLGRVNVDIEPMSS